MTAVAPQGLRPDPPALEASEPPEARGLRRDAVRLLVSQPGVPARHARFADLSRYLTAGDLVVVNTSATLPAAVDARAPGGTPVVVHVSSRLPGGLHLVEVRRPAEPASLPWLDTDLAGVTVSMPGGALARVLAPYPSSARLWLARLELPASLLAYLGAHGRPIRYRHVARDWPLSAYQTVYATEPGSAEMPSAGRAFTHEVLTSLVTGGVAVTPLVLHAGVSSLEVGETPPPEEYRVPEVTAERVNAVHAAGARVVAVGTTVVRALETVADARGRAHPGQGWTDRVVTPLAPPRVVDALLTGWHEPEASHMKMLEALAGPDLLTEAYSEARRAGYLWHEFGDLHLLLP
ncbi:MAG: S-adenosylmethionine:tRNA ribosyltransferase-isomerase [Acidimicrobiales bacterium]